MARTRSKKKQKDAVDLPVKPIVTKEDFVGLVAHNPRALSFMNDYWSRLCGFRNFKFLYIEEIQGEDRIREVRELCFKRIVDIEEKTPQRVASVECLKQLYQWKEDAAEAILLVRALEKEPGLDARAVIEEHFQTFPRMVAGKKLSVEWMTLILRRALSNEEWVKTWAINQSMELIKSGQLDISFMTKFILPEFTDNVICRLLVNDELSLFFDSLKSVCNAFQFSQECAHELLVFMGKLDCPDLLCLFACAMREFPKKPILMELPHRKLMEAVFETANKIRFPTIRYMTIWMLILFFFRIYTKDRLVVNYVSYGLSLIRQNVPPRFFETVINSIVKRLKKWDVSHITGPPPKEYLPSCNFSWYRLEENLLRRKWAEVERQQWTSFLRTVQKTLKTIENEHFVNVPLLLCSYLTLPENERTLLTDELESKLFHAVIDRCAKSRVTHVEYKKAITLCVPFMDMHLKKTNNRIQEYATQIMELIERSPRGCHLIHLLHLEVIMDRMKDRCHADYCDMYPKVQSYLGDNIENILAKRNFKPPQSMNKSETNDCSLLSNEFHAIKIKIYRKFNTGRGNRNLVAQMCGDLLKLDTTRFEARVEIMKLLADVIAEHPDPLSVLKLCLTHIIEVRLNLKSAWEAYAILPLKVLFKFNNDPTNQKEAMAYLEKVFDRGLGTSPADYHPDPRRVAFDKTPHSRPDPVHGVGFASWDPRAGLAILEVVEEKWPFDQTDPVGGKPSSKGARVDESLLCPLLIKMALFHPCDDIPMSVNLEKKRFQRKLEYELMMFCFEKLISSQLLRDEYDLERIDEISPTICYRSILLMLKTTEINAVIYGLCQRIRETVDLERVRRRALEVLLVLSARFETFRIREVQIILLLCVHVFTSPSFGPYEKLLAEWLLAKIGSMSSEGLQQLSDYQPDSELDEESSRNFRTSMTHVSAFIARATNQTVQETSRGDGEPHDEMMHRLFGDFKPDNKRRSFNESEEWNEEQSEEDKDSHRASAILRSRPRLLDFLVSELNIKKHFTLQMILYEIPKMFDVAREELISPKIINSVKRNQQIRRLSCDTIFLRKLRECTNE